MILLFRGPVIPTRGNGVFRIAQAHQPLAPAEARKHNPIVSRNSFQQCYENRILAIAS